MGSATPRTALTLQFCICSVYTDGPTLVRIVATINWSDATTALCWIKNERVWKQYVQHRVEEIRSLVPKNSWRHCPSELNPAGIPSFGQIAKSLSVNSMWWNGSSFLQQPKEKWPKSQTVLEENVQSINQSRGLL